MHAGADRGLPPRDERAARPSRATRTIFISEVANNQSPYRSTGTQRGQYREQLGFRAGVLCGLHPKSARDRDPVIDSVLAMRARLQGRVPVEQLLSVPAPAALTGQRARFVHEAKPLKRWYSVSAYRVGGPESRRIAVLFNDITGIKRAEQRLRDTQKLETLGVLASGIAHDFCRGTCRLARRGGG